MPARFWTLFLLGFALLWGSAAPSAGEAAALEIQISSQPEGAFFEVGEPVTFQVEVFHQGRPLDFGSLEYQLSFDAFQTLEKDSLAITSRPLSITGTADRSGFLRCDVRVRAGGLPDRTASAAAGIAPEFITPSREIPMDFDAFWTEQKERLAATPLQIQMTSFTPPGRAPSATVDVFDTQVKTDTPWPVSGYFARPKKRLSGTHPALIFTHGAGVRSASWERAVWGSLQGYLSFDLNTHGIPNGQPNAYYRELVTDGRLKNYETQGRENRDGYYFKNALLRVIRTVDFLTSQPEWDGRVVAIIGHSLGGMQAIAAAGLDERVSFIGAGVPAMCDHLGMIRRRSSGWPKLVPVLPGGKPDPVIGEVSRYYDVVNFAARCHAESVVSVGFLDRVCPPSSVYAAYNQLRGEKQILNEPAMGHSAPGHIQERFFEALRDHINRSQPKPLDGANLGEGSGE